LPTSSNDVISTSHIYVEFRWKHVGYESWIHVGCRRYAEVE